MTRTVTVLVLLLLSFASEIRAQSRQTFEATRVATPPKIDGALDDEAWTQTPLALNEWISYQPNRGDKMPPQFRTDVRIAYDDRNIYFAFHCFDDDPAKIRTNISRRDSAFNDDWIAISLDSAGNGQSAYHLFVNPSGSQMDALNTSASGEQFDADLVWYSVGNVTSDGYIVEVQVPLQTLRFSGGERVRMGIMFFRKISRTGISYSSPPMAPGQWVFESNDNYLFNKLTPPRLLELLPSITYGIRQDRDGSARWNPVDRDTDVGLNGKFGITSNITLDGTINPDFSQVESDSFQVEVNQRFPIFYSEKRPFFMEGMGLFNIAGTGGPSNMRTGVHTRRIINPFWGTKLTGTAGKTTFGVLNAWDDSPEDIGDRGDAIADRNKLFTIARATYALRGADYLGAIFTDTEHAGRHNRVIGADVSIKFSAPQQLSATVLTSDTGTGASEDARGSAAQLFYSVNTRRATFASQAEYFSRAFQMDTAFYNRTGFTAGWMFGEVHFYPKQGTGFWLQRVTPAVFVRRGHDELQDGNEGVVSTALNFAFTRQAHVSINHNRGLESWRGREFSTGRGISTFASAQVFRWLNVYGGFNKGREIHYDLVELGHSRSVSSGFTLQPNQHLSQSVDISNVRFERAATKERVFGLTIVNLRTTYQFDKHFLVRLLSQYDSSRPRVLTDLLGSYEFVPGTVFHAGYGSLFEKRAAPPGALDTSGRYLTVNRGLFFKASYLRRF